jgi:thioester reductase-like protein
MNKKVLLTGGTGFLGSYLLLYLLRNTDSTISCLARSKNNVSAEERLRERLRSMLEGPLGSEPEFAVDLEREWGRVIVMEGDVQKSSLGLSAEDYAELDCGEVWHVAADVDFSAHRREQIYQTNVGGTRHVLKLMRDKGCSVLNYVSTAYVCGQRAGSIPEEAADESYSTNNVYEESKRIAEGEIFAANAEGWLRFRIFRPSVIVGHSRTLEVDSSSGLYSYLAVLLRLKDSIECRMPEYFTHNPLRLRFDDDVTLNLICVDHVVRTMHRIAEQEATANQIIHVVNPYPVTLSKYARVLSRIIGIDVENEKLEEKLNAVDALMDAQADIYAAYLRHNKQFDFDKMLRLSAAPQEPFCIDDAAQGELTRRVHEHYMNARRKQKRHLRSVTQRLEPRTMRREGAEPMRYYAGGKGETTLVILNAYGQSLAFWDWAVSELSERYRVLIWQARGTKSHGGGVSRVHPVREHVADMAAILDEEQVETCAVVGWCTGPKLAFEFCRRHPGRASSVVSLSGCFKDWAGGEALYTDYERHMEQLCRMIDDGPEVAGALTGVLKGVLTGRVKTSPRGAGEPADHNTLVKDVLRLVSDGIKPLVIEPFLTPESIISYARQLLQFWGHDVTVALRATAVPVLFVGGEMDNIASPEMSRRAASLVPGAFYAEVRGGSHYLQYDSHRLVCDLIDAFLREAREFDFSHGLVRVERPAAVTC